MFNVLENSIYLQDMHFPNKFLLRSENKQRTSANS